MKTICVQSKFEAKGFKTCFTCAYYIFYSYYLFYSIQTHNILFTFRYIIQLYYYKISQQRYKFYFSVVKCAVFKRN